MRQHDGVGQAVGRVVAPAKLVGDGVHIAHVGTREGQAGVGGSQGHLLACGQVLAVAVAGAQVAKDHAHRGQRHAVGIRRGPVAHKGLHGMGQSVDAGGCGDVRWQAGHQARVQRGHAGHQPWIDDDHLVLVLGVGDDGGHGHLRAGTGRGGHGVDDRR